MDEFKRLATWRKIVVVCSVFYLLLMIAPLVLLILTSESFSVGKLFLVLLPPLVGTCLYYVLFSRYRTHYKHRVVRAVLERNWEQVIYDPERALSQQAVEATSLLPSGCTYSSKNYVAGKYRGISFEAADVTATQERPFGIARSEVTTVFDGRWVVFAFEKAFGFTLQIREKSFPYDKQGPICQENAPERLEPIYPNNAAFHRFFRVYANSRPDAERLLTPHFLAELLRVKGELYGDLLIGFSQNELHVGLHGAPDAFEPKPLSRLDRKKAEKAVLHDFRVITSFVDVIRNTEALLSAYAAQEDYNRDGEASPRSTECAR